MSTDQLIRMMTGVEVPRPEIRADPVATKQD
jgi:hypothetical protein